MGLVGVLLVERLCVLLPLNNNDFLDQSLPRLSSVITPLRCRPGGGEVIVAQSDNMRTKLVLILF